MKIGVVDCLESKVDLAAMFSQGVKQKANVETIKYVVPYLKDSPVGAKILLDKKGCDVVVLPVIMKVDEKGLEKVDENMMKVQLDSSKHVFSFIKDTGEFEARSQQEMQSKVHEFVTRITDFVVAFLYRPEELVKLVQKEEGGEKAAGKQKFSPEMMKELAALMGGGK